MTASAFSAAVAAVRAGASPDTAAEDLLQQLTEDERLGLLDGDLPFWDAMADMLGNGYNRTPYPMGRVDRLGIPGLLFSDGPRGVVMGASTAFPVSMARGATWDTTLEERVGTAIGREMRAQGANFFGGVCINLPRHPAWGRAQETYGEDPVLLGEFGAALTRSVQRHAMAVAKHYALNSMENARFTVDVTADDATLHEVYLAHFRRVVDEGVAGIMTAYNSVNGEWAGQNEDLMEGVLRRRWGFTGVTVSDFIWGLRDAATSLRAGLDVEEPFQQQRARHLSADLAEGRASWDDVDRAARRILRTQIHHYATREPEEPSLGEVFGDAHRALAREVAARSMVLLRNEQVAGAPVLPLRRDAVSSVAVIGRLADLPNTGDHGSSDVRAPEVVTPLRGLTEALPHATIRHVAEDSPEAAAEAARASDVAVVVVGYTAMDEGEYIGSAMFADPALLALFPPADDSPAGQELLGRLTEQAGTDLSIVGSQGAGGDRASLRLRPADAEIIRAVAAANPRTVVAVVTAGAVITEEWRDAAPAVLLAWYSGCEGGRALADVLLGEVDTAGRLPFSIPTTEDHLPFFDRDATAITYDKWFGQRLLDRDGHRAAFPLGFGLSYTTFTLSGLEAGPVSGETFDATVTVTNTGPRDGRHVVQLYGLPTGAGDDFPARVLLGFASVAVPAGRSVRVTVPASVRPLQRWTGDGFAPAAPTATIEAAAYAGDPAAVTASSPWPGR
ncbi:glycoside hydrolase family 3 C-terminal domain-containing protein [Couchioplanes caeruleus]|uniref:glycoside hydrolase family 3 protein n=1 Tax=Couchioplanes caeruleus TaxID=56438 RepID=UPI00201C9EA8|nr:glycoside hydrolase family 3 C-terminal domain-containing protein [Couchioplanes caeruleus]UQU67868.1 glycoside hydrolase family 3 C-terminal domain-containing protein [Couchioplanes caeruleus]